MSEFGPEPSPDDMRMIGADADPNPVRGPAADTPDRAPDRRMGREEEDPRLKIFVTLDEKRACKIHDYLYKTAGRTVQQANNYKTKLELGMLVTDEETESYKRNEDRAKAYSAALATMNVSQKTIEKRFTRLSKNPQITLTYNLKQIDEIQAALQSRADHKQGELTGDPRHITGGPLTGEKREEGEEELANVNRMTAYLDDLRRRRSLPALPTERIKNIYTVPRDRFRKWNAKRQNRF